MSESRLDEKKERHDEANFLHITQQEHKESEKIVMDLFLEEHTDWLIEQVEKLEKIIKLSNAEGITLADFAKETLKIVESREIPTRKERS